VCFSNVLIQKSRFIYKLLTHLIYIETILMPISAFILLIQILRVKSLKGKINRKDKR